MALVATFWGTLVEEEEVDGACFGGSFLADATVVDVVVVVVAAVDGVILPWLLDVTLFLVIFLIPSCFVVSSGVSTRAMSVLFVRRFAMAKAGDGVVVVTPIGLDA